MIELAHECRRDAGEVTERALRVLVREVRDQRAPVFRAKAAVIHATQASQSRG